MMKMKRKCTLLYIALAALLTACSSDGGDTPDAPVPQPDQSGGSMIAYTVNSDDPVSRSTRGSLVEYYTDMTEREIEVSAILDHNGEAYFSFKDGRLTCDEEGNWNTTTSNYWPLQTLHFYAYQPYQDQNIKNRIDYACIKYQVPPKSDDQTDLMYAVTRNKTKSDRVVDLNFKHALSAISFEAKTESPQVSVVLSGIDLYNVRTKGTFTCPSESTQAPVTNEETNETVDNSPLGSWEVDDSENSWGYVSAGISPITLTTENLEVTTENGVMMVLPQKGLTAWNRGTDEAPNAISGTGCYLVIHCRLMYEGLYFAGSETDYGEVYVPFEPSDGKFEMGTHYTVSLTFGLGYTSVGTKNKIKVNVQSTITSWNKETLYFEKKYI